MFTCKSFSNWGSLIFCWKPGLISINLITHFQLILFCQPKSGWAFKGCHQRIFSNWEYPFFFVENQLWFPLIRLPLTSLLYTAKPCLGFLMVASKQVSQIGDLRIRQRKQKRGHPLTTWTWMEWGGIAKWIYYYYITLTYLVKWVMYKPHG